MVNVLVIQTPDHTTATSSFGGKCVRDKKTYWWVGEFFPLILFNVNELTK
jgi:hypothetical protein